jgi:uncharacterized protein
MRMKYFFLPFLISVLSLKGFSQKSNDNSFYKPRPETYTAVNDYAGMFTKTERAALTKKLLQYRDTSTNEIVIITQHTLKDPFNKQTQQLEEAAKHYFNNWGIGLKEKNNGVLIFIVKGDRKIRIATGLGIENILTNDDCKRIIDHNIVPQFKKKNYYHGLDTAIQKMMEVLSPEIYGIKNEAASISDNSFSTPDNFTPGSFSTSAGSAVHSMAEVPVKAAPRQLVMPNYFPAQHVF